MGEEQLPVPMLTAQELEAFVQNVFPQSNSEDFQVTNLSPGFIEVSMKIRDSDLRPGGTISGPSMFKLADISAYFIVLAHVGKQALAVTTSLNINFLRKPEPGDLIARCELLKLGRRLAICEIKIFSRAHIDTAIGPVAQATATYSVPPKKMN